MKGSKILYRLSLILFPGILHFSCNSQETNSYTEKERLSLGAKVILPNVRGRIDHIAYDSISHLAFIAALANNSVEVVDLHTRQLVHTITGLREPQGVMCIPLQKKLIVANGDNGACVFFSLPTYGQLKAVDLKSDADNIRYDESSNLLYVGYDHGIAIIDPGSLKQVANIPLDNHPESFQISKQQDRIYINVPDANEIEVADVSTNKIIAKWKNTTASLNFPMAIDEGKNRLFVGCRRPARLRMINSETGKDISVVSCSGDADDIFYHASDSLVFVSAGSGFIDVFRAGDKELVRINHISTSSNARTSLLLLHEKKFLLAVPAHAGIKAALWIYNID
jgi:DNA-binding beta-propeller fold protein YncE